MKDVMEYSLDMVLNKMTALLIIDMQNDFVHNRGVFAQSGIEVRQYQLLVDRKSTRLNSSHWE